MAADEARADLFAGELVEEFLLVGDRAALLDSY
jgi:hypothetical protein